MRLTEPSRLDILRAPRRRLDLPAGTATPSTYAMAPRQSELTEMPNRGSESYATIPIEPDGAHGCPLGQSYARNA